jgi:GNAT superfamily N-acetyltransferase
MSPAGRAVIRVATLEDVPSIRVILTAHGNDGPVGPGGVDVVGPYVRQLIGHHRALVSEIDGAVVAFGAVVHAGVADHLSDLFVAPEHLGRGIGRPLLAELFAGSSVRTTFASDDPRALPSYVRAGMTPRWISLYLRGDAGPLPVAPQLSIATASADDLAALEAAWTGAERGVDHAFWASLPDPDAFVIEDAGGPVAFGYARAKQNTTVRALDRLLVRPGVDPVPPILAGIVRAGRGGPVQASIPGPNPSLPVLLEHGFRVVDHDQYLASTPDPVDAERRLPNGGML